MRRDVAYDARQLSTGDTSVFFASVHEWGNYPGSGAATERGEGPGLGFTLNCPLPGGSDGPAVLKALTAVLRPAAERFRPQLVLVSAGFDSHRDDPLGSFRLEDSDYEFAEKPPGKPRF
ncbi:hypothetical protein VB716_10855 [Synechococcus sp. CCY9201]|uniref:hypothetical protein n=1 Tax=Synechococcus sp. CCY9201 TaxID=174697 RepID=UPI002B20FA55|nr:hypothetical protein [Synechococcus sp. CCY9201]MEA5474719.1 hypothetical protein [Synechococcus sp. CCY9201]